MTLKSFLLISKIIANLLITVIIGTVILIVCENHPVVGVISTIILTVITNKDQW